MRAAPHIVIADDEPIVAELSKRILAACLPEAHITVVANGLAALDVCVGQCVDLLLIDYQMPRLNGIDLARSLRARGQQLPIILMSSSGVDLADVYSAGVDYFLAKPWSMAQLWAAVRGIDCMKRQALPNAPGVDEDQPGVHTSA